MMFARPVRGVPGRGGDTMRGGTATTRGGRKRASIIVLAAVTALGSVLAMASGPGANADSTRGVDTAGLVVDDWGGLHAYHVGTGTRPAFSGGPYWPGQDVARGVAASPGRGGIVVDDWGGLHPFSVAGSA